MDIVQRIQQPHMLRYLLIALVLIAVIVLLIIPETRFRLAHFDLGFRHGWEDQQNRLIYATEAPIWKITRNSQDWRQGDVDLVRRLVASSPDEVNVVVLVFMVGYHLGFFVSEFWIVIAFLSLVFAGMIFWRSFARHHYRKSATVTFSRAGNKQ